MINSCGGLVIDFEHRNLGLHLTLTCARHRTWAIVWTATQFDMGLPAGRANVLRVVVETMMLRIAHVHKADLCECAKVAT